MQRRTPNATWEVVDDAVGLLRCRLVAFAGGQPIYDCQAGMLL
jgi:hypothetical protein